MQDTLFKGKRRSDVEVRVIGAVTFQVDFSVLDFCLQVCWPVDKLVKLVIEPFLSSQKPYNKHFYTIKN